MSASARPITPTRFAAALRDLPLSTLAAKVEEIRNSMTHLRSSNSELREFAAQGDRDCAEALLENDEVLRRMEERILLIMVEVEMNRGLTWADVKSGAVTDDATANEGARLENGTSGRLTDAELTREVAARMKEDAPRDEDEDGGVHL